MSTEIEKKVNRIIEAYAGNEHLPPETEKEFAEWLLDERHRKEKEQALGALWVLPEKAVKQPAMPH